MIWQGSECMLEEAIKQLKVAPTNGTPHQPRQPATITLDQPAIHHAPPLPTPPPRITNTTTTASGAISSMAHSHGKLLVGACCSQQQEYNRAGELQLLDLSTSSASASDLTALQLSGHGVDQQRRTVSVVQPTASGFVSAGYDGCVCGWGGGGGGLEWRVRVSSKPVLSMAVAGGGAVVCGTALGQLISIGGSSGTDTHNVLHTMPTSNVIGANWIDIIETTGSDVFVGSAFATTSRSGSLESWDLDTQAVKQQVCTLPPLRGLSAVCATAEGVVLVASGSVIHNRPDIVGDGLIRLFDTRDTQKSGTIKTSMLDVDCVVKCPQSRLVAVGDAQDHRWCVYDLAFPTVPVASGQCTQAGTACDDTIALCFSPDSSCLYAGGHDGHLYKTDLASGRLVCKLLMASSVTSILPVYSFGVECAVGTEGGAVQLVGF